MVGLAVSGNTLWTKRMMEARRWQVGLDGPRS